MRKIEKRSDCPISFTLDIIGDKWTILILRDIALANKHFYKEFLEAGEGIATNVLADRLKILETYGIIQSEQYEKMKTMKYYSLTERGIALIPLLIEFWQWGATFDPQTTVKKSDLAHRVSHKNEAIDHLQKTARKAMCQ